MAVGIIDFNKLNHFEKPILSIINNIIDDGGFVNVLVLTGIIGFLCGLAIWIALIIIK